MKQASNISEGLTRNSLVDLVIPLISVDEYQSKISDKRVIVVGFYVADEDPAKDLSNFIDRSHQPILDTEVSPAPTPEGNFMVFVEIQRNDEFPTTLAEILAEIENLCGIKEWMFQHPGDDDPLEFSEESIREQITLDPDEILELPDTDEPVKTDVKKDQKASTDIKEHAEFWKNSEIDGFEIDGNLLKLFSRDSIEEYFVHQQVPKNLSIIPDSTDARRLQATLGNRFAVFDTNHGLLVENDSHQIMISKLS